ncbi:hypothetical protein ACET3Z_001024 [Daucus carota]
MISPAAAYTQTLYYHVVNGRHTIEDLQRVCYLDTLLTHYSVLVNQNAVNDTVVDGVAIALPDLFVGPRIVVHGLDGILVPGELGLDDPVRDPEFHRELSPQASIRSEFVSPSFSPVSFNSPAMSPMSFETAADFDSTATSPAPDMLSPRSEPESVTPPISSPSESESRSKSSKRKNRGKVGRSKGRRHRRARNVHDRHERRPAIMFDNSDGMTTALAEVGFTIEEEKDDFTSARLELKQGVPASG